MFHVNRGLCYVYRDRNLEKEQACGVKDKFRFGHHHLHQPNQVLFSAKNLEFREEAHTFSITGVPTRAQATKHP